MYPEGIHRQLPSADFKIRPHIAPILKDPLVSQPMQIRFLYNISNLLIGQGGRVHEQNSGISAVGVDQKCTYVRPIGP